MNFHLYPKRFWQRLLVWVPMVVVIYALITVGACAVADALEPPPPPDAVFWLPASLSVGVMALWFAPLALFFCGLAALMLPHRKPFNAADGLSCGLLLLVVLALLIGGVVVMW